MKKTNKKIFSKNAYLLAKIILCVILTALLILPPFLSVFDHNCCGDHCMICLLSSGTGAIAFQCCLLAIAFSVFFINRTSIRKAMQRETLVSLKRKLSI